MAPECQMQYATKDRRQGFSLIEILIVLSIVAILASILYPAFVQAREKARQSTCQSNIRQLLNAIHQYAQDNDECMPISWNVIAQVGPRLTADSGGKLQQRGLQVDLASYVKTPGVFDCPDDRGIQIDVNNTAAKSATIPFLATDGATAPDPNAISEPLGISAGDAFGVSYKFTKENFTYASGIGGQSFTCSGAGTVCLGPATGKKPSNSALYTTPPPNPMPLAFFARPSETRVVRDFLSIPGNTEKWANASTFWHSQGEIVGFADGHVKMIHDSTGEKALCDGPTSSPAYDGSCNISGSERYK